MFNIYRTKPSVSAYQLREIPSKLWKKFKIRCQEKDIPTLQHALLNFVKQFTDGKINYKP